MILISYQTSHQCFDLLFKSPPCILTILVVDIYCQWYCKTFWCMGLNFLIWKWYCKTTLYRFCIVVLHKLHCSFGNYNWIFALSLAFNLTNLKSRGYPYEELGGQEKSRTTQEQGNSKLDFWKLHCSFHLITIGFLLFPWPSTSPI